MEGLISQFAGNAFAGVSTWWGEGTLQLEA